MAALDLTQLKWATLRSVEQSQAIEKENILLRLEIADLRAKTTSQRPRPPPLDVGKLQGTSANLREDLGRLRHAVHAEMDGCQTDVVLAARQLCGQLLAMVLARDKKVAQLTTTHAALDAEVRQLRDTVSSADTVALATRQQQAALDDALGQLAEAREELGRSERRREEMVDEGRAAKQQLDTALREGKQAAVRADAMGAEGRRLKARLSVVEYESREALEAAARAEADTREQCEKILVDFESENSFLFKRIGELEGENERLRALLLAPKTDNNFAKFVQLKSENAALKTQINTAARKKLAQLGMRHSGSGSSGSSSVTSSAPSPAFPSSNNSSSSSSSGGGRNSGGGEGTRKARAAVPEPLSVSCDDNNPSGCAQGAGPATGASAAPGPEPEPVRRTSKVIMIPQINSSDELADDDSCFGNGDDGDSDAAMASAPWQSSQHGDPASAGTHRSTWSSQQPQQPVRTTTPPPQGRGSGQTQRPIDDSDDEFSPMRRPPKPLPGPPGPQQRQQGQTTVAGVMAASSSLDIGVPLLNKQTRTALKDRIVV